MKIGIYTWTATVKGGVAKCWLKTPGGRIVATATGASVRAAQHNALETTRDEGAQLCLRQVHFPDGPTE
jgi:hypothetical protein